MTSLDTQKPRRSMLAKLAAGSLLAIGLLTVGIAPASADNWKHGNGHGKHWKHNQGHWDGHGGGYYYKQRPPKVVYYQPAPVYYAPPPPVYYAPPPPVYYQPVPVYPSRPSVSIVFPINID